MSIILLGPQRFNPSVSSALESAGTPKGPVAVISAGWREREAELEELSEHLDREVVSLDLYRRANELPEADPDLTEALHERQNDLKAIQQFYRLQLDFALGAARELLRRNGEPWADEHRRSAIRVVKTVDRQHMTRTRTVHDSFEKSWDPASRDAVRRHIDELRSDCERCVAVLVAGGHVATLLNRLRLFGFKDWAKDKTVVAWSAGAMALGDRVVLFHDHPPQGAGNAEVLEEGLQMHRGLVPLPHANKRMDIQDERRVELFARRFSPATCATLDQNTFLQWNGERWSSRPGTRRLNRSGKLVGMTR